MSTPLVIDVTGLTKRFGERTVVDHFEIRVPKGAIYGFLGPNGSGKTTTIRMLCGLLTPDAGEGTCLGFDVRREAERIKEEVGYMTQKFSYYEDLTIADFARLVADVTGYRGTIVFDPSRPDGMPRKLLEVSKLKALGWQATIPLRAGLAQAYADFLSRQTPASVSSSS